MNWKIQFDKLAIFPKSIYRFDAILLKIWVTVFFFKLISQLKNSCGKAENPEFFRFVGLHMLSTDENI